MLVLSGYEWSTSANKHPIDWVKCCHLFGSFPIIYTYIVYSDDVIFAIDSSISISTTYALVARHFFNRLV